MGAANLGALLSGSPISGVGRLGIVVAAMVAVLAVAYWPSLAGFVSVWESRDTYSHGYLLAVMFPYLIWKAGRQARTHAVHPNPWFLAPLLGLSLSWLLFRLTHVQVLELALMPLILGCWLLAAVGLRRSWHFLFAFAFVYFAVPFWDVLTPVLQAITVVVTETLLALVGIPVHIQGNLVTIPEGRFEIAEGCAGLGLLVVSLTVVTLFAYLYYGSNRRRLLLIVAGTLFGMVVNWIRVFTIILAGHLTDMQHYLVTVDHSNLGWVIFAIALVPFLLLAGRFAGGDADEKRADAPRASPALASEDTGREAKGMIPAVLVATGIAIVGPVLALYAQGPANEYGTDADFRLGPLPGGWQSLGWTSAEWQPRFDGATSSYSDAFIRGEELMEVRVVVYMQESQGRELISDMNRLFDEERWQAGRTRTMDVGTRDEKVQVNQVVLSSKEESMEVWFWYEIGGQPIADRRRAKLMQAWSVIRGRHDAAMLAVGRRCGESCDEPSEAMKEFVHGLRSSAAASLASLNEFKPQVSKETSHE